MAFVGHTHNGYDSLRVRASTLIWDLVRRIEALEVIIQEYLLPDIAIGADIGKEDLPFGRVYARQVIATGDDPGFPALIRSPRYDGVSGQDLYTYVDDPNSDRWWHLRNSSPDHWLGLDVEGELKVGGVARLDTSPVQLNTIFDYGDISIEPSPAASDGVLYVRHQSGGVAHLDVSGNIASGGIVEGVHGSFSDSVETITLYNGGGDLILQAYSASGVPRVHIQDTSSGGDADLEVARNIIVGGTVDGVDISAHASDASAHHTRYTDSEAISAVESAQFTDLEAQKLFNSLGDLILQAYSASGVPRVHIQDLRWGCRLRGRPKYHRRWHSGRRGYLSACVRYECAPCPLT